MSSMKKCRDDCNTLDDCNISDDSKVFKNYPGYAEWWESLNDDVKNSIIDDLQKKRELKRLVQLKKIKPSSYGINKEHFEFLTGLRNNDVVEFRVNGGKKQKAKLEYYWAGPGFFNVKLKATESDEHSDEYSDEYNVHDETGCPINEVFNSIHSDVYGNITIYTKNKTYGMCYEKV